MSKKIRIQFQYQINDDVTLGMMVSAWPPRYLVGANPEELIEWGAPEWPQKLRIVERWTQECPGGVQKQYRVRAAMYSAREGCLAFHPNLLQVNEEELIPWEEAVRLVVDRTQFLASAGTLRRVIISSKRRAEMLEKLTNAIQQEKEQINQEENWDEEDPPKQAKQEMPHHEEGD